MFENNIYIIPFNTLKNNFDLQFNIILDNNLNYIIIADIPKIKKISVWFWCFFNGILPLKIITYDTIFRNEPEKYKSYWILNYTKSIVNKYVNKNIIFINDDYKDISFPCIPRLSYYPFFILYDRIIATLKESKKGKKKK